MTPRLKGRAAAIARYGGLRSFALRTLYSWLTMTMLYLFVWPLLVVYADAPAVPPEETPAGWYQLRLLPPLLVAAVATWLWRLSPVPVATLDPRGALALFRCGRVWPQVLVFLLGMCVVVGGFMLAHDPPGALKLLLLTLAETLVILVLTSGYLHGAFELLLEDRKPVAAALCATGLYAFLFGLRAALAVAGESGSGDEYVVAISAGIVVGALVGGVASWLRDRSGSLLPGVLALWLTFLLLALPEFYDEDAGARGHATSR
jgi:hypothetical protein